MKDKSKAINEVIKKFICLFLFFFYEYSLNSYNTVPELIRTLCNK